MLKGLPPLVVHFRFLPGLTCGDVACVFLDVTGISSCCCCFSWGYWYFSMVLVLLDVIVFFFLVLLVYRTGILLVFPKVTRFFLSILLIFLYITGIIRCYRFSLI